MRLLRLFAGSGTPAKRGFLCLAWLAGFGAVAAVHAQGCYEFDAAGISLQINVTTIIFHTGPVDGVTTYAFSGNNTFTQGGTTQTSTDVATGSVEITYSPGISGQLANTSFEMSVPNADTGGTGFWTVTLAGPGEVLAGELLPSPQGFPSLSSWTGIGNVPGALLGVHHFGQAAIDYTITALGPCGAATGGGSSTGTGGSTSATSPLEDLGDPSSIAGDCGCSEPVNLATGNVYYEVTDYRTAGANPLQFTRYYNSLAAASGNTFAAMLGPDWRSNYDRYLRFVSSTSVIAERPDGQQVTFTLNGSTWTTDTDNDLMLTSSGSTWILTDHWDNVETYLNSGGSEGVLQTIQARNGYTQTLKYTSGNLSAVTDSYNRSLGFVINNGLLQSVTTVDGTLLTYGFTSGTLSSVGYQTTPATSQTYVYGNSSFPTALTGIIDENGATYISWTYDSMGRALTGQLAGGVNLDTFTYNSDGSRTATNALGETELYKFTTLQNVPKVIEVDRQATATTAAATSTYTYDSNGYTASHTDWNGNVTTYVNDVHGQPTSITEAAGTPQARTMTVTYLSNFHLPSQLVIPGLTISYAYDSNGELLTRTLTDTTNNSLPYSTNGQSRTWRFTWSNFLLASAQTPRTDVTGLTKLAYDGTGALTSITNAMGQTVQVSKHLPGGLPETMVDPNGVMVNLSYDARQRLINSAMTTAAGVLTTSYSRDAVGNLTGVTLPDGSAVTASYDGAHRLTGIADLFNQQEQLTLDELGNVTKAAWVDANGVTQRTHASVFDSLGRMLQDTGGVNQTTSFGYDANGNTVTMSDPLNHKMQWAYDALNRPNASTNAANGVVTANYDAHNRPVRATDAIGATTAYVYDGFGDLIQQTSPASGTAIYRYDAGGNLVQRVDARGVTANATFDALDRITSIAYPGGSAENVAYTYDQSGHGFGIGRLTSVSDAAGTVSFTYDERGNELSETRTYTGATLKTSYTYDAASRVSSVTYPSQAAVSYARDKMGRVTAVTAKQVGASGSQPVVSNITYQPFGPVTALTFGNGVAETRSYDRDYRLTKLTGAGSSPVESLTYGYDAANNVLSITDGVTAANTQNLGYDALNRLSSAAGGYGSLAYSYDANGNRTKEGSPTAAMDGLGTVTAFTYNQTGRLAAAMQGSQQISQYTYDAFGARLVKQTSAVTIYQYDRQRRLLEEANGQGGAQTDYIYLDGRPVATIEQSSGGQLYFLHGDRLGTPQVATDKNQNAAWVGNYQPFGALNTATSQTATLAQDVRLPGQVADAETGLSQNGFRYYAAGWGRYSQSDPTGLLGGTNAYNYAGGSPLGSIDPLGLCMVVVSPDGSTVTLTGWPQDMPVNPITVWRELAVVDNLGFGQSTVTLQASQWESMSPDQQQGLQTSLDNLATAQFQEVYPSSQWIASSYTVDLNTYSDVWWYNNSLGQPQGSVGYLQAQQASLKTYLFQLQASNLNLSAPIVDVQSQIAAVTSALNYAQQGAAGVMQGIYVIDSNGRFQWNPNR